MRKDTLITSDGIRKVLKNYTPSTAIAEYIWNGYDAKATKIDVAYEANELGRIEFISVSDNGTGINLTNLKDKFEKFYDSKKAINIKSPKNTSVLHGRNGVGRLTFFTFASDADWETTFIDERGQLKNGKIIIDSSSLQSYNLIESNEPMQHTGTVVTFTNVTVFAQLLVSEVVPFLIREFSWFLELNKSFELTINGVAVDYESTVADRESIGYECDGVDFDVNYIQWQAGLNKEQSKFYYLDESGREVYKEFTSLNRKGDRFYHSVYVQSKFFNNFSRFNSQDDVQHALFGSSTSGQIFKSLCIELGKYLKSKKKPLLRAYGEKLVESFESSGVLPEYSNSWGKLRLAELKEVIVGLYEVQPKIFVDLNIEQKKTFVRFLDLLLDSDEREKIFDILNDITSLDSDELQDLASLLKSTKLSRVISMLKMIEDRFKAVGQLEAMVFNPNLGANEVKHVQSMIESHYWIFGEEYNLVTAAEPKFEEALRRYTKHLNINYDDKGIEHPYKFKEMDIFMCRQDVKIDRIHNIVVELKHPDIKLGDKELSQVKKYMNVISQQPEFNASNMTWDFILVGNGFNKIKEIEQALESTASNGERSLAFKTSRYKIYVKTWSEIFTEFRLKHQFIDTKLRIERANLTSSELTADAALAAAQKNSAISNPELSV